MNNSKYLDADGPGHMAGNRINEGSISGLQNNARFGASLRSYTCNVTRREYVSVFATRDISPEEEIKASYGDSVRWTFPNVTPRTETSESSDTDRSDQDSAMQGKRARMNHLRKMVTPQMLMRRKHPPTHTQTRRSLLELYASSLVITLPLYLVILSPFLIGIVANRPRPAPGIREGLISHLSRSPEAFGANSVLGVAAEVLSLVVITVLSTVLEGARSSATAGCWGAVAVAGAVATSDSCN